MNRNQPTITTVFRVPQTGRFGYSYAFEGDRAHHVITGCATLQDALVACDPHRECVWEDPNGAHQRVLFVSRDYKEGSVMWRMTPLTLAKIADR